jgi:hypothetical protein
MKHKVSELEGALLDLAVAKAEGLTPIAGQPAGYFYWTDPKHGNCSGWFNPSDNWDIGGPIVHRDEIFLQPPSDEHHHGGSTPGWNRYDYWRATVSARTRVWFKPEDKLPGALLGERGRVGRGAGPTPLIAAMRAKVASHFGDEVDLP